MLVKVLTHPLFLASAISFFIGSFGYIIVRLWLRPVMRYSLTKRQIQSELKLLYADDTVRKQTSELSANLRRHADALSSVYHGDLPYWYRLLLEKREEDPIRAAALLMKLTNTRNPDHARRQGDQIMAFLKLNRS